MSKEQPSKKLRLEYQSSTTATSFGELVNNQSEDEEIWGEEISVDDRMMQEIESQAVSQYQTIKFMQTQNDHHPQRTSTHEDLEQQLQTKQGEVTNLRIEKDRITKEFKNQLDAKDEVIEKLNKQLRGNQAEFEFKVAEIKSQACRTPKTPKYSKYQLKTNGSSFRERFQFTQISLMKDAKVFNFGGQLNKGDILYKLVRRAFNLNEANFSLRIEKENGSTLFLNCCLLQLCRLASYDKPVANNLIALVMSKSVQVLTDFLLELSSSDSKGDRKQSTKVVILSKTGEKDNRTEEASSLLTNAKWFSEERGVAVRQTITVLAKLMQIEVPLLVAKAVKADKSCENGTSEQTVCTSDILELLDEIVEEISFQKKLKQFEGIYSSILYFCYTFCARYNMNVPIDNSKTRIASMLKKIMFSVPGYVAVRYIIDLLSSSARYGLSDDLCHRSAADTFSENLTSFSFSRETCELQVLSAYAETMDKSLRFIGVIVAWLVKMTTASFQRIRWMSNQTDSKLCECLPTLEQVTIRIMLHCVERNKNANLTFTEKILLHSSMKRCFRIFKQFKWQDEQLHIHITNCSIEYEMLLFHLKQITEDDSTEKSIVEEMKILQSNSKFQPPSTVNNKNHLIRSVLGFSPIIEREPQ